MLARPFRLLVGVGLRRSLINQNIHRTTAISVVQMNLNGEMRLTQMNINKDLTLDEAFCFSGRGKKEPIPDSTKAQKPTTDKPTKNGKVPAAKGTEPKKAEKPALKKEVEEPKTQKKPATKTTQPPQQEVPPAKQPKAPKSAAKKTAAKEQTPLLKEVSPAKKDAPPTTKPVKAHKPTAPKSAKPASKPTEETVGSQSTPSQTEPPTAMKPTECANTTAPDLSPTADRRPVQQPTKNDGCVQTADEKTVPHPQTHPAARIETEDEYHQGKPAFTKWTNHKGSPWDAVDDTDDERK